ncbi:MAG: deoxyribonuclease V [Syntrophaceae bacterium]|nr:deoxyribonuclease V [Syntrophaceae bacterium]
MRVLSLHPWDLPCREAVFLQKELRGRLILDDRSFPSSLQTIAGADVSYARGSDRFFAAVVVLAYPSLELLEEASAEDRSAFPYVPGLLSFREGPVVLKAFGRLRRTPDAVLFDGQGIAHPRGIGLASHLGLFLDLPAIGCAKTRLYGAHGEVAPEKGSTADLLADGAIVGAALRTRDRVKPVYVSQGHRVSLGKAVGVVLDCCRGYRLPEPVRLAHRTVNRVRVEAGD